MSQSDEHLLKLKDVRKYFPVWRGILRRRASCQVRAVDGVDLEIRRGETLSLVGESGSGKSTVGRLIVGLDTVSDGEILFHSRDTEQSAVRDITRLPTNAIKALRQQIQLIFQDSFASLNPRMTVGQIVAEPLKVNGIAVGKKLATLVREQIERVGLRADQLSNYPHEFSGGQRQRIGIARALVINPEFVVADEPFSALDASVQAQVLNLLMDLCAENQLTLLFISHDLSVVKCPIPDDHISPCRSALFMARSILSARRDGRMTC